LLPPITSQRTVSTYDDIARTRLYKTPTYMEVTGVLAAYDLPDLLAARAPRPAVVADVIDATWMAALVGFKEARDAYAFTAQQYATGKGTSQGQGKEAFKVCSTFLLSGTIQRLNALRRYRVWAKPGTRKCNGHCGSIHRAGCRFAIAGRAIKISEG
jgi:hypothetical protein